MAFHEDRLPTDISRGATGGPGFKTTINTTDGGQEHRISRWSLPRHRYDVGYGVRTAVQLGAIKRFFMARQGSAYGFRFKDYVDFTTAADGQSAYDATDQICYKLSATTYQLRKGYTSGAETLWRTITKPVSGRYLVAVDGVVPATQPSLDTTSGILTFASDQGASVITWGGEFDVPVRFDESVDDLLSLSITDIEQFAATGIELVELPPENTGYEDFPMRGSAEHTLTGALSLELTALLWSLDGGAADRDINLPVISDLSLWPGGGPYWVIHNTGSTDDLLIKHNTTTLTTLAPDDKATVYLRNDAATYDWVVLT